MMILDLRVALLLRAWDRERCTVSKMFFPLNFFTNNWTACRLQARRSPANGDQPSLLIVVKLNQTYALPAGRLPAAGVLERIH